MAGAHAGHFQQHGQGFSIIAVGTHSDVLGGIAVGSCVHVYTDVHAFGECLTELVVHAFIHAFAKLKTTLGLLGFFRSLFFDFLGQALGVGLGKLSEFFGPHLGHFCTGCARFSFDVTLLYATCYSCCHGLILAHCFFCHRLHVSIGLG